MKSIKARLLSTIIVLVSVLLLALGGTSILLNYLSTSSALKSSMTAAAQVAAERVYEELNGYRTLVEEIGLSPELSDPSLSVAQKMQFLNEKVSVYGFTGTNLVATNGKTLQDASVDISGRAYFQSAVKGTPTISEPLVNAVTGNLTIVVAAPVWQNGVKNSTISGVVLFELPSMLNDIAKSVKVSPNGGAYINNEQGTSIGHYREEFVTNGNNTIQNAKSNKKLKAIADLEQKMCNQESGFGVYTYNGVTKFLAYAPIQGTTWSIGLNAPVNDFLGMMWVSVGITIALLVVGMILAVIIAGVLTQKIATPVKLCAKRLELLADGDLETAVPTVDAQDETGILADATTKIVEHINAIIADLGGALDALAHGDLTFRSSMEYMGGFAALKNSTTAVFDDLTHTMVDINNASEQVATGAEQVSSGAQALSQGATEQASSIEQLSAAIAEISRQIKGSADDARVADEMSTTAGEEIALGNQHMKDMIQAMEAITTTSNEIGKIIKTIDDIAFQTNILALNAAVEAARAGSAGKGFAVVADEVRNLAQKSAEAAKNTTTLIEGSIAAVGKGTSIASDTAKSLELIVEKQEEVSGRIRKIADAMKHQSEGVSQITTGIDQISSVVQVNSATSEESAAASEELSAQAQTLKTAVSKFKLG